MTRPMRRIRQKLDSEEVRRVLEETKTGVLALIDDENLPYALPINYVFDKDRTIYFHSAAKGRKIDAVHAHPDASFCVIAQDTVIPEKFTTCYESVIVQGTIELARSDEEKRLALKMLVRKYCPQQDDESIRREIDDAFERTAVLKLVIRECIGKAGKEWFSRVLR